ncbi:hypothetical protein [Kitasatospora sp. A2-31]|uniref:hypothetical protein n=1 Tax=Kitasatospora sp. A2-31 TaxID=2916414 RepID=UPI0027E39009|nr:hypothetical protein [Kitasatospora sp. A2-31]
MDDAFTLLRRAADLLSEEAAAAGDGAAAASGLTVADIHTELDLCEWELALYLLAELADACPASVAFWELLAEASRQMMLEDSRRWCEWRAGEARHGTVRARLAMRRPGEGRRRTAFAGDGQLRPLWDVGLRTADGRWILDTARIWVEGVPRLGPGESADVRLAPLRPELWRHLGPGAVITMHEGQPVEGTATVLEVLPGRG